MEKRKTGQPNAGSVESCWITQPDRCEAAAVLSPVALCPASSMAEYESSKSMYIHTPNTCTQHPCSLTQSEHYLHQHTHKCTQQPHKHELCGRPDACPPLWWINIKVTGDIYRQLLCITAVYGLEDFRCTDSCVSWSPLGLGAPGKCSPTLSLCDVARHPTDLHSVDLSSSWSG